LIDSGKVSGYGDLYRLTADDFRQFYKQGGKLAEKLVEGIDASRHRGLARVLTAIAIPHVGTRAAQLLARRFGSIDELLAATIDDLAGVPEIGPVIAGSVHGYLHGAAGRKVIKALRDAGVKLVEDRPEAFRQSFAGKTLVVTGTLRGFTRQEAQAAIEARGGRAANSVSKKTDYLLAGSEAGSKREKAERLGVPIITEEQFAAMLEDQSP
jgi:DNA ligase (NAD+)